MAKTPVLNLRVDPDRKSRWQAAAAKAGLTLTAWLIEAGDVYAATVGRPTGPPPKPEDAVQSVMPPLAHKLFKGPDPKVKR